MLKITAFQNGVYEWLTRDELRVSSLWTFSMCDGGSRSRSWKKGGGEIQAFQHAMRALPPLLTVLGC